MLTFWVIFAYSLYLVQCTVLPQVRILGMSTYLSVGTRRISRGMMTMLLSVIFCLLASTLAQDDCPANANSPSCADPVEDTICQLTCDRDSGEVCAQSDEAKCSQIGIDVGTETYPDMYPTRCKEICEASRDAESPGSICRFYKVSVSSLRVSYNCSPFM